MRVGVCVVMCVCVITHNSHTFSHTQTHTHTLSLSHTHTHTSHLIQRQGQAAFEKKNNEEKKMSRYQWVCSRVEV